MNHCTHILVRVNEVHNIIFWRPTETIASNDAAVLNDQQCSVRIIAINSALGLVTMKSWTCLGDFPR